MGGKGSGGGRPGTGRPSTYWRGTIGTEARAALAVMAVEDAVRGGIEQDEAEAQLLACLILAERKRRLAATQAENWDGKEIL